MEKSASCPSQRMTAMQTPSSTNAIPSPMERRIGRPALRRKRVPLALMRAQGRLRRERVPQICTLQTAPLRACTFAAWALTA